MPEGARIIIKKKGGGHGGHHGGAWKVAYADFVTAMMALFIVLWLMSSSKPVQEAVGGYFRDPSGHDKTAGNPKPGGPAKDTLELGKDNMQKLKEEIEKKIDQMGDMKDLKKQVEITITNEGLRIELIESAKGTFFASGSASPSDNCKELVKMLAGELAKLPNKISIEGHTDSHKYGPNATYTNWELSADRANAARRIIESNGITDDKIAQVRGFADQRLRHPDKPEDPSNRRISMIVLYQEAPKGSEVGAGQKFPEKEGEKKSEGGHEGGGEKKAEGHGESKPAEHH